MRPRSLSIGGFREAIVHTFESEFNLREKRVRRDTPLQLLLMKFDLFFQFYLFIIWFYGLKHIAAQFYCSSYKAKESILFEECCQ